MLLRRFANFMPTEEDFRPAPTTKPTDTPATTPKTRGLDEMTAEELLPYVKRYGKLVGKAGGGRPRKAQPPDPQAAQATDAPK